MAAKRKQAANNPSSASMSGMFREPSASSCSNSSALPASEPAYHLLLWREGNRPEHEQYADCAALCARLQALLGEEVWVYVMQGWPCHLTPGPFRFLLLPDDQTCPLFELPSPGSERTFCAFLGDAEEALEMPVWSEETDAEGAVSDTGEEVTAVLDDTEEDFFYTDEETNSDAT